MMTRRKLLVAFGGVLAARCNVLGRIVGDSRVLAKVKSGDRIRVEAA